MNKKLLITYAIYLWTIIGTLVALSYPLWVTAKGVEPPPETLEAKITRLSVEYEVDEKVALAIMKCESGLRPEAINVNKNETIDYGLWQINNFYWEDYMFEMGWDIKNPDDNLEAGFYLLSVSGTAPWIWSKHCWSAILS